MNLLLETSVGVRLSDNLLNHAQAVYGIGAQAGGAAPERAQLGVEADPELAQAIGRSSLHKDGTAAVMVPRLLVLAADDPSADGVRRALTSPRFPILAGEVVTHAGRTTLRLPADDLPLLWQACEQVYAAHYRAYWASREALLGQLAQQADDRLRYAEIPDKLARLTGREPPHADIEAYLLDSESFVSYSGGGERVCMSTTLLSHFERFVYVFAHECALIYLRNPPWWEVEPCGSACARLTGEMLDAVETCLAQYLAATIALHYGPDPGCWMVDTRVEDAMARRWRAFVSAPAKGIDLLLEQVVKELHGATARPAAVRPRRLSVTYSETGIPQRCSIGERRF